MQLDVFTLMPHAFAWLTEQRPVATVLGGELDLRLFSYRETTPLKNGQVDDEPFGGGAGMVLRVDVVAAALESVYGAEPAQRVVALSPQGRQLTQAIVEELAAEPHVTLLSARFEGFDERIVEHLATDSISIGPYVLSNGDLPAMVLVDAIARRLPGALSEGSGELESFSDELGGGLEYPHYTRAHRELAEGARAVRNPIDYLTEGLPHGWRVTIDWLVTIVGAIAIVLAIKAWVVNPYRIPSSSMEPTLHCAKPGSECEARFSDRVLACRFCFRFWSPKRGDIIVFHTPPLAAVRCGAGGTFVKRLIGLPGEVWSEKAGYVYINGKRLSEPYIKPDRRDTRTVAPLKIAPKHYFMMGDNRVSSCDSRSWGTVPRGNLIGKVFATYWPPGRISIR
jgi:tRNA (guanine-N1)-methyltransferase/signal peptidase I